MASALHQTLDGTWTNAPDPNALPEAVQGATRETNGTLEQFTNGKWLPISVAHNASMANEADPLIAAAQQTLASTAPESQLLAQATPQLDGARGLKAQFPGAYDDMSDAELQAKLDAKNGGQGYHPGASTSPVRAGLEGFLSGAAEGATSPAGKTAIGGAASLMGPVGAPVAAGAEGLAGLLGVHYNNANAPQSLGEAAANVGEAAAAPLTTSAASAAAPFVAKTLSTLPKTVTGLGGAALGGYEGYKHGGIPGAVEGALAGGALGAGLPRSMQALRGVAGMAPEAAAEAEAGAHLPQNPHALNITPLSGTQVPTNSVDDVLSALHKPSPFAPDTSDPLGEPIRASQESPITPYTQNKTGVDPLNYADAGARSNPTNPFTNAPPPSPESFAGLRQAAGANVRPSQGSNPVVDRTLNEIRDETQQGILDPKTAKKANAQSQMFRRRGF